MKSIGFNFTSSDIYFVVLEGTIATPVFIEKNKISLPTNYNVPQTVNWFESELMAIINNHNPDRISYRLTVNNVTNKYVQNVYYAQAILNLICFRKQIEITHKAPASITPSKLNLPQKTNLYTFIDNTIGTHPPHWNKNMQNSALIALTELA